MNLHRFAPPGTLVIAKGPTVLRGDPKNMIGVTLDSPLIGIVVAAVGLETAPDDWSTEVRMILVGDQLGWVNAQELEVVTKAA